MRSLYPRFRLSRVRLEEFDVEFADGQAPLGEVLLHRALQVRLDGAEVFAPPHPGLQVYLGPGVSPGLHADRGTENVGYTFCHRRDLLLDHAASDVCAAAHTHAPGGRGPELG